jgi:PPK2 family polyphosphate:nucleotide phosphotransferase
MSKPKIVPNIGENVHLKDYDPSDNLGLNEEETRAKTAELQQKLSDLQEKLYAQGKYSVLVVLQAMDAGGKDGAIRSVFTGVNPQGVRVTSFKAPSAEELSHDFLWRIHQQTPPKGFIGVFNRSHYEDVLVVRVNNLVPKEVWQKRYDHINHFEQMLANNGTTILKFYLHISKAEQKERFLERLQEPEKNWKFAIGDLKVREQWDDYMQAFESVFSQCHTAHAPWHIVPANRKWVRNYVISKAIVDAMEKMPLAYPAPHDGLDQIVIPD